MAHDEAKRPSEGYWEKGLKKKMVEQRGSANFYPFVWQPNTQTSRGMLNSLFR
jgi:hypothetical protein